MFTLARRTLQPSRGHTVQSPFIFWGEKAGNNCSASPWVQSLCWLCNHLFCFLFKNCDSASSLSCSCRLTDRKNVFAHILALPSWVVHHLTPDFFFFPRHSSCFLFQAFSDVLALFISVVSFPVPCRGDRGDSVIQCLRLGVALGNSSSSDQLDPSLLAQSAQKQSTRDVQAGQ